MIRIRGLVPYLPRAPGVPPTPHKIIISPEYINAPFMKWRVPEEDNRLKALWPQFSVQEIADMMGRSRRTIVDKAAKLNLTRVACPIPVSLAATQST